MDDWIADQFGGSSMRLRALTFVLMILLGSTHAWPYGVVQFPPAARTAEAAIEGFGTRAEIVVNYVACGREAEYYSNRRLMRDEDGYQAGEGLLQILIAKVAWLRANERSGTSCKYELVLDRTDEGVAKILDIIADDSLPTRCSVPQFYDLGGPKVRFFYEVSAECMRAQINEGVRAMAKNSIAGTTGIPCLVGSDVPFVVQIPEGEYDVVLRDLTRLLIVGTERYPILEPATVDHMWKNLLSLRGGPSADSYSATGLCSDRPGEDLGLPEDYADGKSWTHDLFGALGDILEWLLELSAKESVASAAGVPGLAAIPFMIALDPFSDPTGVFSIQIGESENHRLMIESAKYLTNQKMIEALETIDHGNLSDVKREQEELREWILKRLQEIANSDFDEYNARPYTRYSLNAIANLYEFAEKDEAIRTASQIVLDLSGAKYAVGNSSGRRSPPFRRLADVNIDSDLFPQLNGGDHEALRGLLFTGQTHLLNDRIDGDIVASMIYAATGEYKWPKQVLEAAIAETPGRGSFRQTIGHDGTEAYYATPAFTVSLGGEPTDAALDTFGINPNPADFGAAVPSVILPVVGGRNANEVFRIRGTGSQEDRETNLCGYEGFICGTNPELPNAFYEKCLEHSEGDVISFFSSIRCFPKGLHFYAAALVRQCNGDFCDKDETWGLIEAVHATAAVAGADPDYEQFKVARRAALNAVVLDKDGKGRYVDRLNRAIRFLIDDAGSMTLSVDDQPINPKVTAGGVIARSETPAGALTVIKSPVDGSSITITFFDWKSPMRSDP